MSKRDKGRIGGQFVPLLHTTLDTPAWRACSHGAKWLYVSLKRKYSPNTHNNGRIFLSERDAQKELRSNRDQIRRWFQELQHYGFIVMVKQGSLGVDGKGKAPHWRLPELGMRQGTELDFPTRDFESLGRHQVQEQETRESQATDRQSSSSDRWRRRLVREPRDRRRRRD